MCHHENDVMANIIKYYTLEVCSTKLIRFSTLFSMVNKMEVGAVTQEQIFEHVEYRTQPILREQ